MSHQTEAFEGKLAVVGLGYVGLPLAVAFSEIMDVMLMHRKLHVTARART